MSTNTSNSSSQWRWSWEDLCGPGGFQIWSPETHDLGLCFEHLCLEIPTLVLLATASAYYFGNQAHRVLRGKTQLVAIRTRCFIIAALCLVPLIHVYIHLNKSDTRIEKISYFLAVVESFSWLTHLGYTLILRKKLGLSPRGPVIMLVLWSLLAMLSIVSLRTEILIYETLEPKEYSKSLAYSCSIARVILQVLYGLTLIPSEGSSVYTSYSQSSETDPLLGINAYSGFIEEQDPYYLGVAMEDTNWLSKLLFYWVSPLMRKGNEGRLNHPDDLYDLPDTLSCANLGHKLDKALIGNVDELQRHIGEHSSSSASSSNQLDIQFKGINNPQISLIHALHKCFWLQFYGIGILRLFADCAGFAGPMLLHALVSFIEDKSEAIGYGYAYATGLLCSTLISALCDAHFNFYMAIVGLKIRGALITTIYKKTITAEPSVLNVELSAGEIVNFMSTDTDRIVNSCPSFHAFWSIPFQLAVTLYLLYNQVGFAFLAGLTFSIILIPINKVIANKIGELSTKMMHCKDERVKMMMEILRGIRSIKIYVWEQHFMKVISKMREAEIKHLKGRKYLDALCVYFWATTPVVISLLTFGTYVLVGNKLTAATVFTTMALVNMLISPLNAFPWVLNGVTEAWVSIKRIQRLLNLPDLDIDVYYDADILDDYQSYSIIIKDADFHWGKPLTAEELTQLHTSPRRLQRSNKSKSHTNENDHEQNDGSNFYLSNLNIVVKKGEFVGVMGTVGSGKSSLFSAIQAELAKHQGKIAVADVEKGFGLVTQQPWLQHGTIRDNILFGKMYDLTKYKNIIHACCLNDDFLLLPAGDLTGVGDAGMTLSGGQKARIALARAVYQDKPIYLLDDIISAVDSNVAKHIYQHCIMGLLKFKTKILCTHHVKYLVKADSIIVMEGGRMKQQGKPEEVFSNIDEFLPIDLELGESLPSSELSSSFIDSVEQESPGENDSILDAESRETGNVHFSVYVRYWKAIGHILSISILLALTFMQTSRNLTDWWLSYWVSNEQPSNHSNVSFTYYTKKDLIVLQAQADYIAWEYTVRNYLLIYVLFAALNSFFTLFRAFLFAYGGITAALKVHKSLLRSVVWSKITFFDISPLGRILNRFSSDIYTVDDSLPFILNILLAQTFGVLGSVTLTIYGLPWLCLILVPLIPVYHWLQNYYRITSRELKRLSSVTLSPVYSHFNETLQGLPTIRALRATSRFKRENEENLEANIKAQFASQIASRWLGLRLQFIGVAMVTGVGFIAVIQHQFDVANPGLIGLAISYALSVTGLLNGVVNAFTETEREMIAVERVSQYIEELEPETTYFMMDPPYGWPFHGVVSFNNVILRYRDHLSPALKGVSFETRPAEKVGVVGRTGAGKSSLIAALFRMVELHGGTISIDSTNIAGMSIQALRSRLYCIPQDPFLYSGTIKENLDPLNEFQIPEIWSALARVDLVTFVRNLGGLDSLITSGGTNLSVGQRQLFCLTRAILHNTKVLCIDEATANIDYETDGLIQQTLRTAFRKSTVITIAHRIQTIMDCDRVLVMGDGQVLEFDSPSTLLQDNTSHFYKLVNQE